MFFCNTDGCNWDADNGNKDLMDEDWSPARKMCDQMLADELGYVI